MFVEEVKSKLDVCFEPYGIRSLCCFWFLPKYVDCLLLIFISNVSKVVAGPAHNRVAVAPCLEVPGCSVSFQMLASGCSREPGRRKNFRFRFPRLLRPLTRPRRSPCQRRGKETGNTPEETVHPEETTS